MKRDDVCGFPLKALKILIGGTVGKKPAFIGGVATYDGSFLGFEFVIHER
ncbi:MAG: hypothetical protein AAF224_06245 [Pseudomonadota bacterium]